MNYLNIHKKNQTPSLNKTKEKIEEGFDIRKKRTLEDLINEGKEQGYLTYKEAEKYLAEDISDVSKIADLYDILSKSGIGLVETEEEGNSLSKDKGIEEKDESPNNETFKTLWKYCTANTRLCPNPQRWNDLYRMLKNTKRKPSGGWEPSAPLILAAWGHTMPIEKQLRFKEHIQWASNNNQTEKVGKYLRSLSENDWTHFGEI